MFFSCFVNPFLRSGITVCTVIWCGSLPGFRSYIFLISNLCDFNHSHAYSFGRFELSFFQLNILYLCCAGSEG